MPYRQDELSYLNNAYPFSQQFKALHESIKIRYADIDRMAICLYEEESDLLKTFCYSSDHKSPLTNYQATLTESESLKDIVDTGSPRVINDIEVFDDGIREHTKVVRDAGFHSSYTIPLYEQNRFLGFLFYNSFKSEVFTESLIIELNLYSHIITQLLHTDMAKIETLNSTIKAMESLTDQRDPETGSHIKRMSLYARIIAKELAEKHELDDRSIEDIYRFAPLHDIGKLAIPDSILLKPGKLDADEYEFMKSHALKGKEIIDQLIQVYGFEGIEHLEMLRNISQHHHEAWDGSGYPNQLAESEIPIEARITAVADVFDALTSHRPYKTCWTNEQAFQELERLAGTKLDRECVVALSLHYDEIAKIQSQYRE